MYPSMTVKIYYQYWKDNAPFVELFGVPMATAMYMDTILC